MIALLVSISAGYTLYIAPWEGQGPLSRADRTSSSASRYNLGGGLDRDGEFLCRYRKNVKQQYSCDREVKTYSCMTEYTTKYRFSTRITSRVKRGMTPHLVRLLQIYIATGAMPECEICAKEFLLKKQIVNCVKNPNVFVLSYKNCESMYKSALNI